MRIPWLQSLPSRPDPNVGRWILAAAVLFAATGLVASNRLRIRPERVFLVDAVLMLAAVVPVLALERIRARRAPPEGRVLEAVFHGSPLAIFGLDRHGKVQHYWNPAAHKLFGIPPARALGRPMPIVLPGFQEELRRLLDRAFRGEAITDIQGQGILREGPSFPVNLSLTPVRGEGGQVEAVLVILGDDASQKARLTSLAALLGEKSALLEAVRSAGIVLWAMDPARGRLVHVSSAALEVLGVSRERLLADPKGLAELLAPRDQDKLRFAQAEALAGNVGSFEAPLAIPLHGRTTWTRWTLDLSGGLLRGLIQDITEARELQAQLLHSQKLETVGEFLSAVTHDFNNILMSILGYNELLLLDPDLSPDQKRRLQVMQRGASRGQALAGRLLRYARRGASVRRTTDLNELVSEVIALLEESSPVSIRIRADLDPDLPALVVEPSELHQVIMNLGVNARDAMPEGGEIIFSTSLEDGWIILQVRDTGAGIPATVKERIFDAFFTTKGEGKGTGLGLAVVQRIVPPTEAA